VIRLFRVAELIAVGLVTAVLVVAKLDVSRFDILGPSARRYSRVSIGVKRISLV
jgi:hypothetical protein